jgi:hypothetical protein
VAQGIAHRNPEVEGQSSDAASALSEVILGVRTRSKWSSSSVRLELQALLMRVTVREDRDAAVGGRELVERCGPRPVTQPG